MANVSKYLKELVSSLASVAISGSYTDLTNKPTISAAGASGSYTDLTNKPTLGTAAALDVGNNANNILQKTSDNKYPSGDGSNLTNVIASGLAPSVPYSVISAKTDSNRYASFITKVSNTEISFDTNSGSTPIKVCYPDGSIETNNTLSNIIGISADGTYFIIKEKDITPYTTTLQPTESISTPASPAANQLWLDISTIPYVPKKWNGTSWNIAQFVKLGEFTRAAGVIGTPISYALNGKYTSDEFAVVTNTIYTKNDNIGTLKADVQLFAKCIIAEGGYAVNSIVKPISFITSTSNRSIPSTKYDRNSSRFCSYNYLSSGMICQNLSTFADLGMTSANWRFYFEVKRSF